MKIIPLSGAFNNGIYWDHEILEAKKKPSEDGFNATWRKGRLSISIGQIRCYETML